MIGLAELLLILVAVTGSTVMVAFFAWVVFRLKRLEEARGTSAPELRELTQRIDALRQELQIANDDVAKLSERMDFTERLLSGDTESGSTADRVTQGRDER